MIASCNHKYILLANLEYHTLYYKKKVILTEDYTIQYLKKNMINKTHLLKQQL